VNVYLELKKKAQQNEPHPENMELGQKKQYRKPGLTSS
jgi:hypothetical protein